MLSKIFPSSICSHLPRPKFSAKLWQNSLSFLCFAITTVFFFWAKSKKRSQFEQKNSLISTEEIFLKQHESAQEKQLTEVFWAAQERRVRQLGSHLGKQADGQTDRPKAWKAGCWNIYTEKPRLKARLPKSQQLAVRADFSFSSHTHRKRTSTNKKKVDHGDLRSFKKENYVNQLWLQAFVK